MILRLIRWFRGYVGFTASGSFPERFINLLNRFGITYWDMLPERGGCSGKMLLSDYRKIRPLARKSGVRLRCTQRSGAVFMWRKYRRRRGILYGAAAAAVLMLVLSQFVWEIRITGAGGISTSQLRSVLSENGLNVGILKSSLEVDNVERAAMIAMPEIRWISVNAMNNCAVVEVRKKALPPKTADSQKPCNITAACDGVITKTTVYNGALSVQKGSAVLRNQLLVSAVVENADESISYVSSDAEIMADVRESREFSQPVNDDIIILNPNYSEKSNLNFLWLTLPLMPSVSPVRADAENFETSRLCVNGSTLPVGTTAAHGFQLERRKVKLTKAQAEQRLRTRAALYECFCEGKSRVKSRKLSITESGGTARLRADYVFNKDIGVTQPLKVKHG